MAGEYYERLGVSTDATTDEIKSAYRERLKHVHPDVSDQSDAQERTRDLIRAKEVLTDEKKRARYDRIGHDRFVATEYEGRGPAADRHRRNRDSESSGTSKTRSTESGTRRNRSTNAESQNRRKRSHQQTSTRGSTGKRSHRRRETSGWSATQSDDDGRTTSHSATDAGSPWDTDTGVSHGTTGRASASTQSGTTATGARTAGATATGSTTDAASRRSRRRTSPTSDTTRGATGPTGGHSVGWYQGGDPSGSTPGSWSFGGQTAPQDSWGFGGLGAGTTSEQAPFVIPPNRILSPGQNILFLILAFVTYPVFTYGAVMPVFGPSARVVYAILLVLLIGFLIVMPELGVAVAGSWTILFPAVLFILDASLLSVNSVIALAVCAFTLGFSLASRALLRTPPARSSG